MKAPDSPRPRFARMYMRSAANTEQRGATDHRISYEDYIAAKLAKPLAAAPARSSRGAAATA